MSPVVTLVAVLVLAPLTYSQSCENADAEVLILGAGISGITAAKTLHDNGITNFTILEQRDRIGGRINSSRFAGAWSAVDRRCGPFCAAEYEEPHYPPGAAVWVTVPSTSGGRHIYSL